MENLSTDPQIHGYSIAGWLYGVLIFVLSFNLYGQGLSTSSKKAAKYYNKAKESLIKREFTEAKELLQKAIEVAPTFSEAYLQLGSIHNRLLEEDLAYENFRKYLDLTEKANSSILQKTAEMAFDRGNYDEAEDLLIRYKDQEGSLSPAINLLFESLAFIKTQDLSAQLAIQPLSSRINQFKLQYLPAFTVDGNTIFFTRRESVEDDEDIVSAIRQNGEWSEPRSISSKINTPFNEGACTIAADGKTLIFTSCDRRDSYGSCDLYISKLANGKWSNPSNLGKTVNSTYWDSQPALSADGKTIFFSSNRPGGEGGRDLWKSELEGEQWSTPQNLGKVVNSFKDETTPFIHQNGQSLFFSSNGHPGMGGFDMFYFHLGKENSLKNMGFPINTHKDEVSLTISSSGKEAFFSKELQSGYTILESQIMSISLPDTLEVPAAYYLNGVIKDSKNELPLKAKLEIINVRNNKSVYSGASDSLDGRFLAVLPSGDTLAIFLSRPGYLYKDFNFFAKANKLVASDTLEIFLDRIEINKKTVLSNIYFDVDAYTLRNASEAELTQLVTFMNTNPNLSISIEGYTDNTGSEEYNQELSEKRAETVFNELITRGISKNRISYKGYGSKNPIKPNTSDANRQSNRRIEFRVIRLGQ